VFVLDWSTSSPTHTVNTYCRPRARPAVSHLNCARLSAYTYLLTCHSLVCDIRGRARLLLVECARGCRHVPLFTYIGRSSTNTYTRAHLPPSLSLALISWPRSIDCGRRHTSVLFSSSPFTCFILILESSGSEYWKICQIWMLPDSELTAGPASGTLLIEAIR